MISELSVHATASNKKAQCICYGALASATLCVLVCFFIDSYRAPISALAVIFIGIAILIYTKYISASYFYDITHDNNGLCVFVVRSRTGKRETTLLRVDLYAITSLMRLTKSEIKSYKRDTGTQKYNYCPSLLPDTCVRMTVRSHYENADVFIEVSDEFIEYLCGITKAAREKHKEE